MIFLSRKNLSLTALGTILLTIMAASTAVAQSFSVEYDVDRGGSDYKNFGVNGGHEVCRDACAGDANCKAYTYTKPYEGYAAHCWLKSSVSTPVPYRSCCISGVKGAAFNSDTGMGAREDNMSLQGTTLSYYQRPAFETCQSDCINNGNCKGFTWIMAGTYSPNDPAMCYLMSAVTGRSPSGRHYSGVKGQGSPQPPPPPPPPPGDQCNTVPGAGPTTYVGTFDFYAWGAITFEMREGCNLAGTFAAFGGGTMWGSVPLNSTTMNLTFRTSGGGTGRGVIQKTGVSDPPYRFYYCDGDGCDPMKQGLVGGRKIR